MALPDDYQNMTSEQLDSYIQDFLAAIYGEEVRDKFARIAYLIGHQIPATAQTSAAEAASPYASAAQTSAQAAASSASNAQSAKTAAEAAKTAAETAKTAAEAAQAAIDDTLDSCLKKTGGTMSGDINMGGNDLTGVSKVTGGPSGLIVSSASGTVDVGNSGAALRLRAYEGLGIILQGSGANGTLQIHNVADPDADTDSANKQYVHNSVEKELRNYIPVSAAIRPTATGNPILVEDSAEAPMQGLYVYGKTTQDGTPSPESPVPLVSAGDNGEIDVTVCGVNMIDAREKVSRNTSGCTLTFDGRGGITINGTAVSDSADIYFIGSYASLKNAIPEGEKTLSTDGLSEDELIFFLYSAGAQESHVSGNKKLTTTRAANAAMVRLKNGKTYDNVTFYPMLNVGATALPWQPYTGKTITISTPNGLPGIPVDSGGNYTDSTGQQWICDEIDVEENKYIKRTFLQTLDENLNYTLNGTNNENLYQYVTYLTTSMDGTNSKALLSDRFAPGAQLGSSTEDPGLWIYGPNTLVIVVQKNIASTADELKQWFAANPTTVLLPLAEPEVSTITADQVNSYGGATTAYTTSGADLTMQYVADAQKYIDNKIGAISTAMLKE